MGLFYYLFARFNARSLRWFSRLAICIKLASIFSNFFCVPISRFALFNFPTLCTIFLGAFAFNIIILLHFNVQLFLVFSVPELNPYNEQKTFLFFG